MGCGQGKSKSVGNLTIGLTVSKSLESVEGLNRHMIRGGSVKKLTGREDFWGTTPFYVINNKFRLLASELQQKEEMKDIF